MAPCTSTSETLTSPCYSTPPPPPHASLYADASYCDETRYYGKEEQAHCARKRPIHHSYGESCSRSNFEVENQRRDFAVEEPSSSFGLRRPLVGTSLLSPQSNISDFLMTHHLILPSIESTQVVGDECGAQLNSRPLSVESASRCVFLDEGLSIPEPDKDLPFSGAVAQNHSCIALSGTKAAPRRISQHTPPYPFGGEEALNSDTHFPNLSPRYFKPVSSYNDAENRASGAAAFRLRPRFEAQSRKKCRVVRPIPTRALPPPSRSTIDEEFVLSALTRNIMFSSYFAAPICHTFAGKSAFELVAPPRDKHMQKKTPSSDTSMPNSFRFDRPKRSLSFDHAGVEDHETLIPPSKSPCPLTAERSFVRKGNAHHREGAYDMHSSGFSSITIQDSESFQHAFTSRAA